MTIVIPWYWVGPVGGAVIFFLLLALFFLYARQSVPNMKLPGKVVLVTGGSAGIGLELAKVLGTKGCHVYIAARRKEVLEDAVRQVQAAAEKAGVSSAEDHTFDFIQVDVSDEENIKKGIEKIHSKHGGIDLCICNAGYSIPARFLDISPAEAKRMMDVNFFGCVNVVRAVLPRMHRRRSGRIVLVSSMGSVACVAGFSIYSATKAAVRAFAQAMDQENAAMGVRFQVLNPPDVATPGYEEENKTKSPECLEICALGGAKPFDAEEVAEKTVRNIEKYSFQINVGMDGVMLGALTAGMEAPVSVLDLFGQFFGMGLLRIVSIVYVKMQYAVVKKVRDRERESGSGGVKTSTTGGDASTPLIK